MRTYYVADIEDETVRTTRASSLARAQMDAGRFERVRSTRAAAQRVLDYLVVAATGAPTCARCGVSVASYNSACPLGCDAGVEQHAEVVCRPLGWR